MESSVYQKPLLQKFGSFRELTLVGLTGSADGASIFGVLSIRRQRRWDRKKPPQFATSS